MGGYKGIAKVIDCRKQCMVNALIGHGNSINEISVHPVDEYLVFTASKDESIRLWNVANGQCVFDLRLPQVRWFNITHFF